MHRQFLGTYTFSLMLPSKCLSISTFKVCPVVLDVVFSADRAFRLPANSCIPTRMQIELRGSFQM